MAGAVSAGAYTAGVIDFLVQALDCWEDGRGRDALAPPHRLRLRALTGASAGAMTAGILAGIAAGREHRPVNRFDPGDDLSDNPLFDSWVNRIDMCNLLATGDLQGRGPDRLLSLLNGEVLADIASAALPSGAGGRRKPWLADELLMALTVTNLRGVPYNIGFADAGNPDQPRAGHGMRRHADQLRFRLPADDAVAAGDRHRPAGCIVLDPAMAGPGWEQLQLAALASGAFPLLLPPRRITRDSRDYLAQRWPSPGSGEFVDGDCDCQRYVSLAPDWGGHGAPERFQFHAVDGGMLDNQPFTAGRELLTGLPPTVPVGPVVNRVLLAIDPFPDLVSYRQQEPEPAGLLDFGLALLSAMKNQTRFKPEELLTAAEDGYASRQLIAPSRRIDGVPMDHPLAGGAIEGFAGFIDRRFRLHDFWLGRANCQRFFGRHFRLPAKHPLFADWSRQQREAWRDGHGRLPVLPLLGSAAEAIATPTWPKIGDQEMQRLSALLRQRSLALLPHAIDHLLARSSRWMRWATLRMAGWQSRGWVQALADQIASQLRQRGQL